jgi:hypothetical protein
MFVSPKIRVLNLQNEVLPCRFSATLQPRSIRNAATQTSLVEQPAGPFTQAGRDIAVGFGAGVVEKDRFASKGFLRPYLVVTN